MKSKLLKDIFIGTILALIICFIGLGISSMYSISYKDTLCYISIGTLIIGGLLSLGGGSRALNLSSLGEVDAQYDANITLEAIQMEKKTKANKGITLNVESLGIIIAGVITFIVSYII
ncbi:MAG: hypothetical protein RR840_04380 [Clostridium sp.]